MYIGVQIDSPLGWGRFRQGTRYYLAGDRTDVFDGVSVATVLIVWFAKTANRWQSWRVQIMKISRRDLEQALTEQPPKLRKCAHQFNLPPWLEDVDDVDFDQIEERRQASAGRSKNHGQSESQSYRQQVEARLNKIAPAMERASDILKAPDPLRAVYDAVKSDKTCHAHRAQLWFFAYVLHGQSEWALKRPTHAIGRWKRDADEHKNKKLGRPALAGSSFGSSTAGMRTTIVNCYLKYCDLGNTMRSIHRKALRKDFGCITVADQDGNDTWMHPANKPFPSYGQFRYIVVDELSLEFVQTQIYGNARMKSKASVNVSNQTAPFASILEELQVDAYFLAERPRSLHSDVPTEPLVVAEAVCVTTGAVVGVGFSFGSETGEAYRSMLFCMAAPKDYISKLYGIPPGKLNWQMQGISSAFTSDRGPAGHRGIADRLEQQFPIKTIAPSYNGQAKAAVETTHPKSTQLEGAPTHLVSDLNVIQMMKRELFRAAAKNHSKDISPRLSDQAIQDFHNEGRVATPHHYWQYLSHRLRTCARELSLQEAVRAFWTPIRLPVDADGVRFRHRHYTSKDLMESSLMKHVGIAKNLEVQAYVLSLVVRTIWVHIDDRLIEIEATSRVRVGDEEKMVTLSEYESTAKRLAELRSKTRTSAQAAVNRAEVEFEALTGVAWDAGGRRKGSPPKPSGSVAHEVKVTKGQKTNRKAA